MGDSRVSRLRPQNLECKVTNTSEIRSPNLPTKAQDKKERESTMQARQATGEGYFLFYNSIIKCKCITTINTEKDIRQQGHHEKPTAGLTVGPARIFVLVFFYCIEQIKENKHYTIQYNNFGLSGFSENKKMQFSPQMVLLFGNKSRNLTHYGAPVAISVHKF